MMFKESRTRMKPIDSDLLFDEVMKKFDEAIKNFPKCVECYVLYAQVSS